MQRKLVVACAVVTGLVLWVGFVVIAFSGRHSGVSAYSMDKRVKIYKAQYFNGTNLNFSYVEPLLRPKYGFESLLRKAGVGRIPWRPTNPAVLLWPGMGPALVVYGRIEVSYESLELVPDEGRSLPLAHSPLPAFAKTNSEFYFWDYTLTNSTYHLRCSGNTNDLAIIRVRL